MRLGSAAIVRGGRGREEKREAASSGSVETPKLIGETGKTRSTLTLSFSQFVLAEDGKSCCLRAHRRPAAPAIADKVMRQNG